MSTQAIRHEFDSIGVRVNLPWLDSCISTLRTKGVTVASELKNRTYQQLLLSNLSASGAVEGSQNGAEAAVTVKGPSMMQIEEVINIGVHLEDRSSVRGMLKVRLTDGAGASFVGFEYSRIHLLSMETLPGTKILLENVPVQRGVLVLTADNTRVLGGGCAPAAPSTVPAAAHNPGRPAVSSRLPQRIDQPSHGPPPSSSSSSSSDDTSSSSQGPTRTPVVQSVAPFVGGRAGVITTAPSAAPQRSATVAGLPQSNTKTGAVPLGEKDQFVEASYSDEENMFDYECGYADEPSDDDEVSTGNHQTAPRQQQQQQQQQQSSHNNKNPSLSHHQPPHLLPQRLSPASSASSASSSSSSSFGTSSSSSSASLSSASSSSSKAPPFRTALEVLDDKDSAAPQSSSSSRQQHTVNGSGIRNSGSGSGNSSSGATVALVASALRAAAGCGGGGGGAPPSSLPTTVDDLLLPDNATPPSPVSRLVFPSSSPPPHQQQQQQQQQQQGRAATDDSDDDGVAVGSKRASPTATRIGSSLSSSSSSSFPPILPFSRIADIPETLVPSVGSGGGDDDSHSRLRERTWRVKGVVSDVEGFKHKKKFLDLRVFVEDASCAKRAVTLSQELASTLIACPYSLKKQDRKTYAARLATAALKLQRLEGCLTLRFLPAPDSSSSSSSSSKEAEQQQQQGVSAWVLTCTAVEPPSLPEDAAALISWVQHRQQQQQQQPAQRGGSGPAPGVSDDSSSKRTKKVVW